MRCSSTSKTTARRGVAAALGFAAATLARAASAEGHGFGYELRALAVVNPAGVRVDADVLYGRSFYRAKSPLLATNGISVRVGTGISPAAILQKMHSIPISES